MADAYATPAATVTPTQNDDKTMALLIHVLGIFTGFLGPLILWLVKKDASPFVNETGKRALNWQFSALIYYGACFLLTFTIILAPFTLLAMVALWVLNLVFCILGAMKANQGQVYTYPLSIRLLK
jgi:uncharacterized protein